MPDLSEIQRLCNWGRRILAKPLKGQIEQHSMPLRWNLFGDCQTSDVLNSEINSRIGLETSRVVSNLLIQMLLRAVGGLLQE